MIKCITFARVGNVPVALPVGVSVMPIGRRGLVMPVAPVGGRIGQADGAAAAGAPGGGALLRPPEQARVSVARPGRGVGPGGGGRRVVVALGAITEDFADAAARSVRHPETEKYII